MAQTLYILDGTYWIFRAFHAVRDMSYEGMPTGALFSFTSMWLNFLRDHKPTHVVVAFDPEGPSFREGLFPAYKANRAECPAELVPQFPFFRELIRAFRVPILEVPGYEADDAIATLCRHPSRRDLDVVILTGDKDLCQLVDARTTLYDSMRDKRVDLDAVRDRFQVDPLRVPDVLGLAGDTSDNIPGVPGIGEKTAGQLIAEFGSMDELLARVDEVKGPKKRESLVTFADQARLSLQLATVFDQVPLDLRLEEFTLEPPDLDAFDSLCTRLGFHRFRSQIREIFGTTAPASTMQSAADFDYRAIQTREAFDEVLAALATAEGPVALDLETTSQEPLDADIVGVALAWEAGHGVYIPLAHRADLFEAQLDRAMVLDALRPWLEDAARAKVCQHAKYEIAVFARAGIALRGVTFDTMLAAWLLDPNRRRYSLDVLAQDLLQHRTITFDEVAGTGAQQKRFDDVPIQEAARYAAEDADVTLRLMEHLQPQVIDTPLHDLLTRMEIPLSHVLADMETTGITVDLDRLSALQVEFRERLAEAEAAAYQAAGRSFNLASPKQLATVLFEELGLPVKKRTKTGPSTDVEVLEALADEHPLPRRILQVRELAKLLSTYVEALPKLVRADTGRVHTSFHQTVAATGRLSSSNPNLQNIPVRTVEGRRIREAFVPRPGWVLLGADYSQIELRILAHLAEEPSWIEAFSEGQDIHRRTASEVFEVPLEQVTADQRAAAKTINFGIIYGMGAQRLAGELGISREQAKAYIDQYFARVSHIRSFFDAQVQSARDTGMARTMWGRQRPIPELAGGAGRNVNLGERLAINTPIQGTAADLIKFAMIDIHQALQDAGMASRMLLQVHDELIFECPPDELATLQPLVRARMEGVVQLRVPLRVDMGTGAHWGALK
jgi:DNA polymerase-1